MLKILSLVNGNEIMGHVTEVSENLLKIEKPLILAMNPKERQIIFLDLLLYSDEKEIEIKRDHIVFMSEPLESMKEKHNDFWGQGSEIVVPDSTIIS